MNIFGRVVFICILFLLTTEVSSGKETPYTLEDRDRLIRVEVRLEEIDKRFEQIDKRFEQVITFIGIITGIFTAITITTISFAIWDRRSMVRPFESRTREIEGEIEIERGKVDRLILSLRELAKSDTQLAAVLKKFSLL